MPLDATMLRKAMLNDLKACLEHWIKSNLDYLSRERERCPLPDVAAALERDHQAITMEMAQTAEAHLRHFLGGNSDKLA
jgi:hypothetical protein